MNSGAVEPDWRKLFELFSEVCRQKDTFSMLRTVMQNIHQLIPIDHGVALNRIKDGVPYCTRWPKYAATYIEKFNSYYNIRCPIEYDWAHHILGPVTWNKYQDTEYDACFNRPMRLGHSIGIGCEDPLSNDEIVLVIHRSRNDIPFSEKDTQSLHLLRPLFAKLYKVYRQKEQLKNEHIQAIECRKECTPLSPREMEIAQLMLHRISLREIGVRLGISPRTVERHAMHIYTKLQVSNRKELIQLLGTNGDHEA